MKVDLFPSTKPPRSKPRILMHVYDAGDATQDGFDMACCFRCVKCGHKEDWVNMKNLTDAKRGIPCPKCETIRQKAKEVWSDAEN